MPTLRINAKCSDLFAADLVDDDGNVLAEYQGYVPDFMPGDHYGDYVQLEIDATTGQIVGWVTVNSGDFDKANDHE